MRIAFCDDDPRLTQLLSVYAQAWAESNKQTVSLQCFSTSEDFLLSWTSSSMFDVVFLDIKMEPLSGLELAQIIRSINSNVTIVFVSAYSEYAIEGYSVDAAHYLLKPVSRQTFFECMDKLVARVLPAQQKFFLIEKGGSTLKLLHDEIMYFEARSHSINVHSTKGIIDYRGRILDLEEKLTPAEGFIRTHRSFLVNLAHIRSMNKSEIQLKNEEILPVSRSYAREAYNAYIRHGG